MSVLIKKKSGITEPYNREKLINSLKRSHAPEEVVSKIADHIEGEIKDGMSTSKIYDHAYFLLRKENSPSAFRYSLRRALSDLGPTGFPFEKYMAEIFKEMGYDTSTNEIIHGKCVPHEVDIVAFNENKVIFCEAKFHNDLNIKSDLKVALYVKARFDDLKVGEFSINGRKLKFTEGWLITNTKFSSIAIQYGKCEGLKLVGWNYPEQGSLHDLIYDTGLHPISSLTTLSNNNKLTLMNQGTVLCKNLKSNTEILHTLGLSPNQIHEILDEVRAVC